MTTFGDSDNAVAEGVESEGVDVASVVVVAVVVVGVGGGDVADDGDGGCCG